MFISFSAWIFQVAGTLTVVAGKKMVLAGGALAGSLCSSGYDVCTQSRFPGNIVWVVTGAVSVAAGAHIEGVVLGKTSISLLTGATANSRLLSQTSVALQKVRQAFCNSNPGTLWLTSRVRLP